MLTQGFKQASTSFGAFKYPLAYRCTAPAYNSSYRHSSMAPRAFAAWSASKWTRAAEALLYSGAPWDPNDVLKFKNMLKGAILAQIFDAAASQKGTLNATLYHLVLSMIRGSALFPYGNGKDLLWL